MEFVTVNCNLHHQSGSKSMRAERGIYINAAILDAMKAVDPEIAVDLHDEVHCKQFAMAVLGHDDPLQLRLSFMSSHISRYINVLVRALAVNETLRLGTTYYGVRQFSLGNSSEGGIWTWKDILSAPVGRYFSFQFLTPTAIIKRRSDGRRYCEILPNPRDVFMSLARRWQGLDGPALPVDFEKFLLEGWCVVHSHSSLHSDSFKTAERRQQGFTGRVTYEWMGDDDLNRLALAALTQFAQFSGVGYQTARGMGMVETSIVEGVA